MLIPIHLLIQLPTFATTNLDVSQSSGSQITVALYVKRRNQLDVEVDDSIEVSSDALGQASGT